VISDPVKQMNGTQPFIQLDNSIYNGFVSQIIFSEWRTASMRRRFFVLNSVSKPQFHKFRPLSATTEYQRVYIYDLSK